MNLPADNQHEARPGVFAFRNRFSRRERKWWILGCASLVTLFNAAALIIWLQPGLPVDVKADWVPGLHVASWLPALICVLAWISPQHTLRVSPRGIAYALVPGGLRCIRQRWRIQWWEIDQLKWGSARCEFKVGGRKRFLQCSIFRKQHRQVTEAISRYLGEWFDLSQGTAAQRWARQWKQVSLWRKALDKVLLLFVGMNCQPIVALVGWLQGNAVLLSAGILLWLAALAIVILQQRRYQNFGWQEPRTDFPDIFEPASIERGGPS